MRLYFYDVVEKLEDRLLFFRCLDTSGRKVLIKQGNVKKKFWLKPPLVVSEDWQTEVIEYLARKFRTTSRVFSCRGVVKKRYVDPDTDAISHETEFLEVECGFEVPHYQLSDLSKYDQTTRRYYSMCLGHTDTYVEQAVLNHGLSGWVEVDDERLRLVSSGLYESLSTTTLSDYQRCFAQSEPRPPFAIVVVYRNSVLYVNSNTLYTPNEEESLVSIVQRLDACVTLIYGQDSELFYGQRGKYPIIDVHEVATEAKLTYANYDEDLADGIYTVLEFARKAKAVEIMCEVSTITWQPWSQTCRHSRKMDRSQWMLYKAFHEVGVVSPTRSRPERVARQDYEGGLVLSAHTGIYDEGAVYLLDYTSLYPSVAIEYSICWSDAGEILPRLWRTLIGKRQALTGVPGSEAESLALKLLANQTYGMLASPYFRYFSLRLAKKITERGREALNIAIGSIDPGYTLLYGDTDSIFPLVDGPLRVEVGEEMAKRVSGNFEFLKMKHETTYKLLFLLGKKCYMSVDLDGKVTVKGMMCVKKQYCGLGKRLIFSAIDKLKECSRQYELAFSSILEEVKEELTKLSSGLLSMVDELMLVKRLKRKPEDYRETKGLYHVEAAKECRRRRFNSKDYVRYYMVEGRKAIVYEDYSDDTPSTIDLQWYCVQVQSMMEQLLSVLPCYNVERIYEVFSPFTELKVRKRSRQLVASSSSSSSSSSVGEIPVLRPIQTFCFECSALVNHWALLKLETQVNESEHKGCSCKDDIPELVVPTNNCEHCGQELSLKSSIRTLVSHQNISNITNASVIYDCNRLLSLVSCAVCREQLFEKLRDAGVYELYEKFSRMLRIY